MSFQKSTFSAFCQARIPNIFTPSQNDAFQCVELSASVHSNSARAVFGWFNDTSAAGDVKVLFYNRTNWLGTNSKITKTANKNCRMQSNEQLRLGPPATQPPATRVDL